MAELEKRPAHRPVKFGERKTLNVKLTPEVIDKLKIVADASFGGNMTSAISGLIEKAYSNLQE